MPFTVEAERQAGLLRLNVAGPASLKNYFDLVNQASTLTQAEGQRLVLVDLRGVAGRLVFTDQFFIGEVVGQKLQHTHRVAVLVATDPGSYNSPTVAKRQGVNLRSFANEEEALAWLLESG